MRDRILSLVSVQGTNGGQNYEKLIQYFIIPLHLMCWLSMLSKLDCFFFYFLLYIVQYVDNQLVICNYLPMQKVLYFNNLFYINDLYMYMCLSRDKLGTKIGVKNAKKNKYRHWNWLFSPVWFNWFFCKVRNLWYYLKQFCLPFITNFVPGDKT